MSIKAKIVDHVDPREEAIAILCCSPGRAPTDLQVNGVCEKCGRDIFWQATAPKHIPRWCSPCAYANMKEDSTSEVRVLKTALAEAAAALGEDQQTVFEVGMARLNEIVEEED